MKQNKNPYNLWYIISFFLCCLALVGDEAKATHFSISTTSLIGQTGQVAFDFIDGGLPSNSFAITNFDFGVGSSIASTVLTGGVSGDVSSNILVNDFDFFNELLVALTFGDQISFDIVNATNLAPDTSSFPDAFSVFLLDDANQSLVSTSDPTGSNSLFRWDSGSSLDESIYSPSVTYSSSVTVPEPGIIYLVIAGILVISNFSRRNKEGENLITSIKALTLWLPFLFLFSGFVSIANASQTSLSQRSTDLTGLFRIDRSGLVFNRSTNTYDSAIKITNISTQQIPLPVAIVVLDTTSGVSVFSPSGTTLEGNPYLIVGVIGQSLGTNISSTVTLKYLNPSRLKISSTFRILAFSTNDTQDLGGSDNNGNGIRDDIEAAVTSHYSSSEKQRAAASQVLAAYRTALLNQRNAEDAFDSVSNFFRATACMKNIFGTAYKEELRYLRNLMLDNKDRIKTWLQLGDKVAGEVFFDPESEPCDFDPKSFPN